MKTLILYFSGTGNTYYCARYLRERLTSAHLEAELHSLESFPREKVARYDLLVVGFPVYAGDVPGIVRDYLRGLPPARAGSAYLFFTKGLCSGNAGHHAAGLLKTAGFRIAGYADVTMPGSDGLAFLKKDSVTAKKLCSRDFSRMEQLDNLAEKIAHDAHNGSFPSSVPRGKISGALMDLLFKPCYPLILHWLRRKFRTDEHCIRCGLCEKLCPVHNIHVTKQAVCFGDRCILCMRCVHQCPQAAIQIGRGTVGKMRWKGPGGCFKPSILQRDGSTEYAE